MEPKEACWCGRIAGADASSPSAAGNGDGVLPCDVADVAASARCTAWNTHWCTARLSRKRTSIFDGCTLTSTSAGSMSSDST
jgi:hypothetical protein